MARRDNRHSRLVVALKIALPLLALVLLSTLFLFSRGIDTTSAIPYSEADVEELAREPRILDPEYAGLTADGTAVTLRAATARTDPMVPGRMSGDDVAAVIETPDGRRTDVTSDSARVDDEAGKVVLEGTVRIQNDAGYDVRSQQLIAALDQTRLESPGEISGRAPMGELEAGRMVLEQSSVNGDYVLVFNEGVRLIYQP